MNKKLEGAYVLIVLLLVILTVGNCIYMYSTTNNSSSKNAYTKKKPQKFTILIEVDEKRLQLIDRENENIIKTYPIATGKPSSPTPLGAFKIIEKGHWGEGFGSRWMGINVPWGKYGIHGTNKPNSIGSNASAGCIRMRNKDVEELYSLVKNDTIVMITNGPYGPFGSGFRELRPGDRGADVMEVQKRLAQKGYYKLAVDGVYGENMKSSLINYLKDNDMILTDRIDSKIYTKLGIILME